MAIGYRESENFVPNPADRTGSVRTDGEGGHFGDLRGISKIFEKARHRSLLTASRSIDPDDNGVDEAHVVLPTGATVVHGDPESAKERLLHKVEEIKDLLRPEDHVAVSTNPNPSTFAALNAEAIKGDSEEKPEITDNAGTPATPEGEGQPPPVQA